MTTTAKPQQRLAYIDWMRGLACIVMFQTHCYDSWLSDSARTTKFFAYSQLGGTLPAPLFLFLAGISTAFVTDRMRQKGIAANQIARTTFRRGAEIFGLSLLFRIQEFLLGQPHAPWTDLLRVDILNTIGLSLILLGVICWIAAVVTGKTGSEDPARLARLRRSSVVLAILAAAAILLAAQPLWTTYRPRWLPWFLESYINGVHTFDRPQAWLFPLFPWAAFGFAGLAIGFLLISLWARRHELPAVTLASAGGALLIGFGFWLDAQPVQLYSAYDFWHTSPAFFLIRAGVLLTLLLPVYAWCRWGAGQWGFNPVIELGQSSLLVYWVHIEFVYGGISILKKHAQTIGSASAGLLVISMSMVVLAAIRNRTKGRGLVFWRSPARATA
jgi:uncharacterized membrane protein